jgi:hypothetical protein
MSIPLQVYQATLILAILATLGALYVVVDRARRPGGRPLLLLLGASLFWLAVTFVYTVAFSFELALTASKLTYVGITLVPIGWFLFALEYTGRDRWVNAPVVGLLLLEAVAVNAIVWFRRELVWETVEPTGTGSGTGPEVIEFGAWGPAFFGHAAFAYIILLVGAAFVLRSLFGSESDVHRGQVFSMLVAVLAPTVGNFAYLALSAQGVLSLDLTPIMFAVSAIAIVIGAYRYSLVEEGPLASAAGIDSLDTPAFLVDDLDTLVDCNVAGAAVLGLDADNAPGTDVATAFENHAELLERYERNPDAAAGLEVTEPVSGDAYVVRTESVTAPGAAQDGTLFVLDPIE